MKTWLDRLKNRTPLGWLQLSHEKGRFLVALAGIAFADVLMFMQLGFQNALYESNTRFHQNINADIVLISPQARNLVNLSTIPRRRLYQAMNVPGVATAQALYTNFSDWRNPQTRQKTAILIVGFSPERSALALPAVANHLNDLKLPDYYLFDQASRGDYQDVIAQLQQGQIVTTEIERHTIYLSQTFAIGASFATDGTLITSDQSFLRLFPRRQATAVSAGLISLQPGANAEQVATTLRATLPEDVRVLTKAAFIQFEKDYWTRNTAIGFVFGLGTVMGFIVGVVIVYQVLSTDVNAHLGEYATFKAMGYRDRYLLGIVFEEAIIMAGLGFIPGLGVSLGLYVLTRNATSLPIAMTLGRSILVFLVTLGMCGISGMIATRKLQQADPADSF
ncbi:ABC transporter permease DevC [Thermosynechococcaceae cyanobacterium BACA0444]|uniref:ABC transporter permease DevC n=1 Tax=Pseudocalidococcus azoricus BACA0444 TaxID=2918990 RepID=A0AAE4JVD8_9CYAN|nr:ABC transporter permease DevC [Pseudocalidococcus azoricus]MDS3860250.1 ABC transporter permease DevC [Pseudocalidococcus azoricus BACA0444]